MARITSSFGQCLLGLALLVLIAGLPLRPASAQVITFTYTNAASVPAAITLASDVTPQSGQFVCVPMWYQANNSTAGTAANIIAQTNNALNFQTCNTQASSNGSATMPGLIVLQQYTPSGAQTIGTPTNPAQIAIGVVLLKNNTVVWFSNGFYLQAAHALDTGFTGFNNTNTTSGTSPSTNACNTTSPSYPTISTTGFAGLAPVATTAVAVSNGSSATFGAAPIASGTSPTNTTYFGPSYFTNNSAIVGSNSSSNTNVTVTGTGVLDGNGASYWGTVRAADGTLTSGGLIQYSGSSSPCSQPSKLLDMKGTGLRVGANFDTLGRNVATTNTVTPAFTAAYPGTSGANNPIGTLLTIRNASKSQLEFESQSSDGITDGVWIYANAGKINVPAGPYAAPSIGASTPATSSNQGMYNGQACLNAQGQFLFGATVTNSGTASAACVAGTGSTATAPGQSNMINAAPNTDAIDVVGMNDDGLHGTLIRNCVLDSGDDDISPKSNKPGQPMMNLTVENCVIGGGHGISVGGQEEGGVYNTRVTNVWMNGTDYGLKIKTNNTDNGTNYDGGVTSNARYQNVCMQNVAIPIQLTLRYAGSGTGSGTGNITPPPIISNIIFDNIIASNVGYANQMTVSDGFTNAQAASPSVNGGAVSTNIALGDISGTSGYTAHPADTCATTVPQSPQVGSCPTTAQTPYDLTPSSNDWVSGTYDCTSGTGCTNSSFTTWDFVQNVRITNSSFSGAANSSTFPVGASGSTYNGTTVISPFTVEEAVVYLGKNTLFNGTTASQLLANMTNQSNPLYVPSASWGTVFSIPDTGPSWTGSGQCPSNLTITIPLQQ
jgi:hypothetical protein